MCLTPEAETECQAGADDQLEYSTKNVVPFTRRNPFAPGAITHHKRPPSRAARLAGLVVFAAIVAGVMFASWVWRAVPADAGAAVGVLFGRVK